MPAAAAAASTSRSDSGSPAQASAIPPLVKIDEMRILRPAGDGDSFFADGARRDLRKHAFAQDLVHTPVAVETGNRYHAAAIEGGPLRRIGLEAAPVGCKIGKSEFADSPLQALADLAAHLTKSGPAEIALRERPLEEASAISIVHGTANQAYSNCLADCSPASHCCRRQRRHLNGTSNSGAGKRDDAGRSNGTPTMAVPVIASLAQSIAARLGATAQTPMPIP